MKVFQGARHGKGLKVAVIVARFNSFITEGLKEGALRALRENGVAERDITLVYCPGAFEVPAAARACVVKNRFRAVICLGAVVRGETDHYHYICDAVTRGLGRLSLESPVPVLFGVLTCQSVKLARARAGKNRRNKGYETALAALEMVNLFKALKP